MKSQEKDKLIKAARESNFEDILIGIGYGRINPDDLISKAFPPPEPKENIEEQLHPEASEERLK